MDPSASKQKKMPRLRVLDGWRGISILCVLAGHLFPLGPSGLEINVTAANFGMAVFFTLSGFLITSTLIYHPSTRDFLIRRLCRIVPLAWLFIVIALTMVRAPLQDYPAHLLFYANLPPFWLTDFTGHLWSLCVEMQFYMGVALLFGFWGRRGLLALPVLAALVTLGRIFTGTTISIVTYLRVDEILAGAILALAYEQMLGEKPRRVLGFLPPYILAPLALASCHPSSGPLNYVRPYLAMALIGTTLFQPALRIASLLQTKWLSYVAEISYALYVIHPIANYGWFAPASKTVKYARRPLGLALSFALGHLSTKYYESRWIAFGKSLTDFSRQPSAFSRQPKKSAVA